MRLPYFPQWPARAQRLIGIGATCWVAFGVCSLADVPQRDRDDEGEALPLPRWSDEELRAFRENLPSMAAPGSPQPGTETAITDITTLLNTPIPSGPRLDHRFEGPDSELSSRLRPEDMRLFLPESILGMSTTSAHTEVARIPTPLSSLREVPRELLDACVQAPAAEYLLDPESQVPEMQGENMRRFLDFHARDARIKLHILVIATDEKLPEHANLDNLASGNLRQNDACLLVYPLGEPWRARLFVSQPVHALTSTAFLSETIQACVTEAMEVSDSHDQLHRYAVHLSTRLFWLQKALAPDLDQVAGQEKRLAEVQPKASNGDEVTGTPHAGLWWAIVSLFGGAALTLGGRRLHRHMRSQQASHVWILPEPETIPRLGGAFTGGGGGTIRYG